MRILEALKNKKPPEEIMNLISVSECTQEDLDESLMEATLNTRYFKVAESLITKGANVNTKDAQGNPLYFL